MEWTRFFTRLSVLSFIRTAVSVIWGNKCIALYAFFNFYRLYNVYCCYMGTCFFFFLFNTLGQNLKLSAYAQDSQFKTYFSRHTRLGYGNAAPGRLMCRFWYFHRSLTICMVKCRSVCNVLERERIHIGLYVHCFCCCRDFLLKMGMCVEGLFHLILFVSGWCCCFARSWGVFCLKCFQKA